MADNELVAKIRAELDVSAYNLSLEKVKLGLKHLGDEMNEIIRARAMWKAVVGDASDLARVIEDLGGKYQELSDKEKAALLILEQKMRMETESKRDSQKRLEAEIKLQEQEAKAAEKAADARAKASAKAEAQRMRDMKAEEAATSKALADLLKVEAAHQKAAAAANAVWNKSMAGISAAAAQAAASMVAPFAAAYQRVSGLMTVPGAMPQAAPGGGVTGTGFGGSQMTPVPAGTPGATQVNGNWFIPTPGVTATPGAGQTVLQRVPAGTPGATFMAGQWWVSAPAAQSQYYRAQQPYQFGGAVAPQTPFPFGSATPLPPSALASMLGTLGGAGLGALGSGGGFGGALGAMGGALAGMGGPAGLALSAVTQGLMTISKEILTAYNNSQDWLRVTSLVRREIGMTAQQASQMRSFLTMTQNPDSPFATIIFSQVQANLKNMKDYNDGLIVMNPQLQKFADGMQRMGLSAVDASGKVKSVTTFTLELSEALQRVPQSARAQISQEIGGLFGKDFMALAASSPDVLRQLRDSSVQISEEQLLMADRRVAAIQAAMNAERQFEIAATAAITPIEIQLQKLKQIAMMELSESMTTDPYMKQIMALRAESLKTGAPLPEYAKPDADMGVFLQNQVGYWENVLAQKAERLKQANAQRVPGMYGQEMAVKTAGAEYSEVAVNLVKAREALAAYNAEQSASISAEKTRERSIKDYQSALDAAKASLSDLKGLEETRLSMNDKAVSAFDSRIDAIVRMGNSYDSFYKSYKDVTDKIEELEKKRDTPVAALYTESGKLLKSTDIKKIAKLEDDIRKEAARDADQAQMMDAREADIRRSISTRKSPPTQAQLLALERAISGTNVSRVQEEIETRRLADRAAELGFGEGDAITTEKLKKVWGTRGLKKEEQEQLAESYERLKELNLQDKEAQFNALRQSMMEFNKRLGQEGVDSQGKFKESLESTVSTLSRFAEEAGLFESVGFSRAIMEASLSAKLAGGGFGEGAAALKAYVDAQTGMYDGLTKINEYISGHANITVEAAKETGILKTGETMLGLLGQGGYSDAGLSAARIADQKSLEERIKAGKVSAGEVMQRFMATQGLDVTQGVEKMYGLDAEKMVNTATRAAQESIDLLKQAKTDLTESEWVIDIEFDSNLGPIEQAIAAITNLKNESKQEGFTPQKKSKGAGFGFRTSLAPGSIDDLTSELLGAQKEAQKVIDKKPIGYLAGMDPNSMSGLNSAIANKMAELQRIADSRVIVIKTRIADPADTGAPAGNSPAQQQEDEWGNRRDIGGSVRHGIPYMVGGTGPEMFVPWADGAIVNAVLTEKLAQTRKMIDVLTKPQSVTNIYNSHAVNVDARSASSPGAVRASVLSAAQSLFFSNTGMMASKTQRRRKGAF